MIKRICRICGKEFFTYPSHIKQQRGKFCSKKCHSKSMEGIPLSGETRRKMGETLMGHPSYTKGMKFSKETKEKMSIAHSGKNAWNWKGGRFRACGGYIYILKPHHPLATKMGYVLEHRLVMEKYLGRFLTRKEIIHHTNNNHSDNLIENLKLFPTKSKHTKFHVVNY